MSNRIKIDPLIKVKLVESYLRSEIGLREAARQAGLAGSGTDSFMKWVNIYKNEGPAGLLPQKHSKSYPLTTKLAAVNDYLEGKGSQLEIAARYGLRSKHQLSNWLKEYNTHGEIRSRGSGGGSYMRKARQTTPEERLEIWRTGGVNVPAHSRPGRLKKSKETGSLNSKGRSVISRWRTTC